MNENLKQELFGIFKHFANSEEIPASYITRAWASCFSAWKGAWRPRGITKDAMNLLISKDFSDLKGIHRAHTISRFEVFERARGKEWKSIDDWWEYMVKYDDCVLATKAENALSDTSEYTLVPLYEIPNDKRSLFETTFIGCKFRKTVEVQFLRELVVDNEAQIG